MKQKWNLNAAYINEVWLTTLVAANISISVNICTSFDGCFAESFGLLISFVSLGSVLSLFQIKLKAENSIQVRLKMFKSDKQKHAWDEIILKEDEIRRNLYEEVKKSANIFFLFAIVTMVGALSVVTWTNNQMQDKRIRDVLNSSSQIEEQLKKIKHNNQNELIRLDELLVSIKKLELKVSKVDSQLTNKKIGMNSIENNK